VLPERVQTAAFEAASRKTSNSLDAYDHLLRGKYCHHLETPEANREAEAHFERSINLDPRFASAFAWKACTLGQAWTNEFRPRTPEFLQEVVQLVEHAVSLDENDTECHRMTCRIALFRAKYAKSNYHLERALAINPNDPRLVVQRGINLTFVGDPKSAIPWIEKAMRLDPFSAHRYYRDLVRALFMDGRLAEAVAVIERTTREHWEHYLWAAASNAALNEEAAALEAAQRAITLRPSCRLRPMSMVGSNGGGPKTGVVFARPLREQDCQDDWAATCLALTLVVQVDGHGRPSSHLVAIGWHWAPHVRPYSSQPTPRRSLRSGCRGLQPPHGR
jgi:adenylate cyclase